jgi:hypothetical protein
MEEVSEHFKLTPDNVLMQTGAILNADMRNYMTWGPNGVNAQAVKRAHS